MKTDPPELARQRAKILEAIDAADLAARDAIAAAVIDSLSTPAYRGFLLPGVGSE